MFAASGARPEVAEPRWHGSLAADRAERHTEMVRDTGWPSTSAVAVTVALLPSKALSRVAMTRDCSAPGCTAWMERVVAFAVISAPTGKASWLPTATSKNTSGPRQMLVAVADTSSAA
ncbi:hypothetical protein GCM10009749_13540 [Agromyces neolithicus]|uniref:Uncharacterized protein n=1 Tax=Agromyces neolithicus TaxID=269420 RepID=A0ABN2M3H6_9MICO